MTNAYSFLCVLAELISSLVKSVVFSTGQKDKLYCWTIPIFSNLNKTLSIVNRLSTMVTIPYLSVVLYCRLIVLYLRDVF